MAGIYKLGRHDGNEYRTAGCFLDGYKFRVVEVIRKVNGPYLTVFGGPHFKDVLFEMWLDIDEATPYAVRSIFCQRSSQTGTLMATLGGLYINESGHDSIVVSTDYVIAEPITHEEFLQGKR